jgi:fumarate hydratase class I
MHDIAHYLRPAHLAQLRRIIDDPEASGNDRFVALDLLKNVNISAGGVLPMCQDTGTAIVMGKKTEGCSPAPTTARRSRAGCTTPTPSSTCATPSSRRSRPGRRRTPAPTCRPRSRSTRRRSTTARPEYKFLFMAKGGGSANKSFLYQETKAVLNPTRMLAVPRREDPLARHRRVPAVPPGVVIGGTERGVRAWKTAQVRQRATTSTTCPPGLV